MRVLDAADPRLTPARTIGRKAAMGWAVGGALAMAVSFPPWDLWFLAPAGPAGLLLAVRGRRAREAFWLGALFGVVFFAALLTWLINLGLAPWLLLTAIQALATGLLGAAFAVAWKRPGRMLTLPGIWVAVEALRSRYPFGGFPWGRLGFSQADSPLASWVSLGGIPLLSWIIAAVGVCGVLAARASRRRRALTAVSAVTVALGGAFVLPAAATAATGGNATSSITVAVVQGNVPRQRAPLGQSQALEVTRNHAQATRALAAQVDAGALPAPDLVIWPESSADRDPGRDPATRAEILAAVTAIDRPVLIGTVLDAPDGRARNVGQLWTPTGGPGATYDKRHLVPFGEYIPFRSVLGGRGDLALIPRDFRPGDGPPTITSGEIRIGDVICYEIAYDDTARAAVRAGANLLVMQSNNATYMRDDQLGETRQQLAMAQLRAIEYDRAVAVATTTGISAIVRPDGTIQAQTGTWRTQTLVEDVELRTTRTVASRLGAWPEALAVVLPFAVPGWLGVAGAGAGRRRLIKHSGRPIGP
ncbi:apolipoprotein N-acyltransferase [Sporichthya sp.]|uniref:apolipoprotein N-acyltransferase n=1 Tax=Sporichthya sp. TaxID=65475 RepID=UPI00184B31C6|nr:apolipoprotein N-acyltransferase [Sporichthya sp.]MBA3744605.1 apolipoprotein N-acyltransferase [Sporichthya sp.]